jgi:hypothetical protein
VPLSVVVHVFCSVLDVEPVEGIRSCVQNDEAATVHEKISVPELPPLPPEPVPPSVPVLTDEPQAPTATTQNVRNTEVRRM